ncbi:hypothetical protein CLOP_g14087 [Closterium sp. NIES-67]|nr:hypothetical protein CLOP_g14087 [Closterium sp. NIES-67]
MDSPDLELPSPLGNFPNLEHLPNVQNAPPQISEFPSRFSRSLPEASAPAFLLDALHEAKPVFSPRNTEASAASNDGTQPTRIHAIRNKSLVISENCKKSTKRRLTRTTSCTIFTALALTEENSLQTGMDLATSTPNNALLQSLPLAADPLRSALLRCPCTPRKPQRPSRFRLNAAPSRLMRRLVF